MQKLDWTDASPPFEQSIKVIFAQMHTFCDFIQGRLGFKVVFDELNRFCNPLKILGLLRIIVKIHFRPHLCSNSLDTVIKKTANGHPNLAAKYGNIRVALASIILLAVVHLKGNDLSSSKGLWGGFIIMGALNNLIPFSLIVWGQTHIESGLASILNGTTPIFSVVLAHFLTSALHWLTSSISECWPPRALRISCWFPF